MIRAYFMVVSVLLAGCFAEAEPTAGEIDHALKKAFSNGAAQGIEYIKSEKKACVAAKEKPGFSCDVGITFLSWNAYMIGMGSYQPKPTKRETSATRNIRFVKTPNGWEVGS